MDRGLSPRLREEPSRRTAPGDCAKAAPGASCRGHLPQFPLGPQCHTAPSGVSTWGCGGRPSPLFVCDSMHTFDTSAPSEPRIPGGVEACSPRWRKSDASQDTVAMVVMLRATYLSLVLAVAVATLAEESKAFEFKVDAFTVDGNLPAGKTDDFDDGVLNGWGVDEGTAEESGGAAILKSPGASGAIQLGGQWVSSETTEIDTTEFDISLQGAGNATATSSWLPDVLPKVNELYSMSATIVFFNSDSSVVGAQKFDVYIINSDSDLAGLVGLTQGLYLGFERQLADSDGNRTTERRFAPISLSSTDELVLQLVFDEAAYQFQAAYSVNGGAFQSPIDPWDINPPSPNAGFWKWDLRAQDFTVIPEPTTAVPS